MKDDSAAGRIRLDKWLWYARQAKSRSLAQKLITGGNVRLNREKTIAVSKTVSPGDVLTLALARDVRVLRILACGTRRGPYQEARLLYEDLSPKTEPSSSRSARLGEPVIGKRPDTRERLAARRLIGKE